VVNDGLDVRGVCSAIWQTSCATVVIHGMGCRVCSFETPLQSTSLTKLRRIDCHSRRGFLEEQNLSVVPRDKRMMMEED
jgi:hypothetical protein